MSERNGVVDRKVRDGDDGRANARVGSRERARHAPAFSSMSLSAWKSMLANAERGLREVARGARLARAAIAGASGGGGLLGRISAETAAARLGRRAHGRRAGRAAHADRRCSRHRLARHVRRRASSEVRRRRRRHTPVASRKCPLEILDRQIKTAAIICIKCLDLDLHSR